MESRLEQLQVVVSYLSKKVDELEKDSHPAIGLCDFDGFKELVERIEKLEKKLNNFGSG